MHSHLLIAIAAVIAIAAGFMALQSEPEPPAPRIVATEPLAPQIPEIEIGGEIIVREPGSGLIVIENETEPHSGFIGALVRAS